MINLHISVKNPKRTEDFKSLWTKVFRLSKNKNWKHWEFQVYRYWYYLLELDIDTNFSGSDHAGPEFHFGLFGYHFRTKIYDSRHWDHDNNTWVTYED